MHETIGLNRPAIETLRKTRGLESDAEFANALGITRPTVNRTMRGIMRPGPRFIAGLKRAFPDVSLDALVIVERITPTKEAV